VRMNSPKTITAK